MSNIIFSPNEIIKLKEMNSYNFDILVSIFKPYHYYTLNDIINNNEIRDYYVLIRIKQDLKLLENNSILYYKDRNIDDIAIYVD